MDVPPPECRLRHPQRGARYPDDGQGFALYARQGQTLHAITHEGRPVRFRTFEKALTTLADVAHLDPEIIVDSSNWCEESGPH